MQSANAVVDGGTPPLFDVEQTWRHEPMVAFEALLTETTDFKKTNNSTRELPKGHLMRGNSVHVYKAMFGKFLEFLSGIKSPIAFIDCGPPQIAEFMDSMGRSCTQATVRRYRRLIERVYDHLVSREFIHGNPVTQWVHGQLAAGKSPILGREAAAPTNVTLDEVTNIQRWLRDAGLKELEAGNWRGARDITLAAISLGTGMRCAELLALGKDQVRYWPKKAAIDRFEFNIPRPRSVETSLVMHATQAEEACVALMEKWWEARWSGFVSSKDDQVRVVVSVKGDLVFPGKVAGTKLDPSTLYKNLKRLAKEGVRLNVLDSRTEWVLSRGAQGLRRAYALSRLEAKSDEQLVRYRMGLHTVESVRRIRDQVEGKG